MAAFPRPHHRRTHGIIDALTSPDVMTFADKGAPGSVRTPFNRCCFRTKLSRRWKTGHHARTRAGGE